MVEISSDTETDQWRRFGLVLITTPTIMLFPFTFVLLVKPTVFGEMLVGEGAWAIWVFFVLPVITGIAILIWRFQRRKHERQVDKQ